MSLGEQIEYATNVIEKSSAHRDGRAFGDVCRSLATYELRMLLRTPLEQRREPLPVLEFYVSG